MTTRDKTFDLIKRVATKSFRKHQITEHTKLDREGGRFGWWKVQEPGTWAYGFYVANMPGMVHVNGDIADITVSRTLDTLFDWFRPGMSIEYFEEKVQSRPRSPGNEWVTAIARESLGTLIEASETHADDPYIVEIENAIAMELGPFPVWEAVDGDDWEYFSDCSDWDVNVLWGYWALTRFIELTRETTQ
jgi:hypothetical protein